MGQCHAKTKEGDLCKIPTAADKKYCHVHLRQRRKRFLKISSIVVSAIVAIVGFAASTVEIVNFFDLGADKTIYNVRIEGDGRNIVAAYRRDRTPLWQTQLDTDIQKVELADLLSRTLITKPGSRIGVEWLHGREASIINRLA
jgi:hypothetical protein